MSSIEILGIGKFIKTKPDVPKKLKIPVTIQLIDDMNEFKKSVKKPEIKPKSRNAYNVSEIK